MQPSKILHRFTEWAAPYIRKLMGRRPDYVSAYENVTGTLAYSNDKAILLDAARMTYNSTSQSTQHHRNAAQWIGQLLKDPEIPAKRRLYTAANIMGSAGCSTADCPLQVAATKVFNTLVHSPSIKHKYRLRAARHVLREAAADNSKEFARRAISALAPISRQPVVSELAPYTVEGPYRSKAIKSAIRSGTLVPLPKAPQA